MTDSEPKIETVNDDNQDTHVQKWQRRRMRKAFRKAKDRRKNFERGEFAGFMYCTGLCAVVVAASGQLNHYSLAWWQRLLMGLVGLIGLVAKTYTKRRFWGQTEDAEYQEEEKNGIDNILIKE